MKFRGLGDSRASVFRITVLAVVFIVAIIAFITRLLSLQVAQSDYYKELAKPKNQKTVLVEATRGEIVDRNGEKLVINHGTKNITLNRSLLPRGKENETILELLRLLDKHYVEITDIMPMSQQPPYRYIQPQDDAQKRYLRVFLRNTELEEEQLSGTGLYEFVEKRYKISSLPEGISQTDVRRIIGIRYAMEANDFSVAVPFVFAENISIMLESELAERLHELQGVQITVENTRYYPGGSLAAHILGRTGPIFADEAEKYRELGYAMNEYVGKDGAELAFEEHLRAVDGYKTVEYSADGKDILSETLSKKNPPKFGKTVELTLSAGMQRAAEESLKNVITSINNENIRQGSKQRASGAVVVQDPNSGAIYVSASYPTYDQNTYRTTITDMLNDESRPLLNRATRGIYPPGSTFKIATAASALSHGIIDENTTIYDSGVYREYDDYQPHCWYFDKYGVAHGRQNVVQAITNSCNYYFFEVGRLLGQDRLNDYASKLGLGEKTGIETGEEQGILASSKYRASLGLPWNPGDLIQSAIGQSDNSFTPLQLASFFSTIVNGGTRYKAHILNAVVDISNGQRITTKPEILDTVELSEEHLEILKRGMKSVVEDGTAASVFINYPHPIGGKTGTAQRGFGDDNAVFAGFAPYDEPKLVVSVIIEAGVYSSAATRVAKSVFDYYFENIEEFER